MKSDACLKTTHSCCQENAEPFSSDIPPRMLVSCSS
jgi:hypothetical protein